jgi:glycosyltransferase involved in cell wall biosynthesis
MRICIVGKFPPIQGGVSAQTYNTAHELARRGHEVFVVTNASQVELGYRQMFIDDDEARLEGCYGTGFVRVVTTDKRPVGHHIPWAQPYVSQLFGLTMSVVQEQNCGVILGWYFEPYGIVAGLVSSITGVPLLLRHAGSDLGRLALHPDLRLTYRWLLGQTRAIMTTPSTIPVLIELGADPGKLKRLRSSLPPRYFIDQATSLDVEATRVAAVAWLDDQPETRISSAAKQLLGGVYDPSLPTIGIYGKVGPTKGTWDLITALERLAAMGMRFNFLALSGGSERNYPRFGQRISESRLATRTIALPFLAPWRVPSFLERCDITCFLERDFPITFHGPKIAREVMLSGSCLVCSGEIADKQPFRESLVDGRNYLRVDDPKDHVSLTEVLAKALSREDVRKSAGAQGRMLMRTLARQATSNDTHADVIEACV